jgi:hypothetical protein
MSRSLATALRPTPVKPGPPQKHWVGNALLSIDLPSVTSSADRRPLGEVDPEVQTIFRRQ